MRNIKKLQILTLILTLILASGCVDPYYDNSGYNPPPRYGDYGGGYGGYDYDPGYDDRKERHKLERERERLEDERRRLERERQENERPVYSPPPRQQERCPSGFTPSENKCSREERKRGCQDMRLPGGLGCVKR